MNRNLFAIVLILTLGLCAAVGAEDAVAEADILDYIPAILVQQHMWYQDSDGDTFGNPNVSQKAVSQPQGYVQDNRDCDDTDPGILVNCPPVAESEDSMPYEDTVAVLNLAFSDAENDPLDVIVTSLEDTSGRSNPGRLFQYDATLASGDLSAIATADEITSFPTTLTDPQGRMLFLGEADTNTQGLPSDKKTYPEYQFYVQETDCCHEGVEGDGPHASATAAGFLFIESVNDPPTLWEDQQGTSESCFDQCTVPMNSSDEMVFAGGHDVEGAILTVIVTDVNCPAGTLVLHDGVTEVTNSTTVSGLFPDMLSPVFLFTPLADETGAPYCTVTYRINDSEDSSEGEFTITIDVVAS